MPNHDIETFNILRKWMELDIIDEPADNGDVIGLMQAYDLASSLEMHVACIALFEKIVDYLDIHLLDVCVLNETAFIPWGCGLREFLRTRVLQQSFRFCTDDKVAERDFLDEENSIWNDEDVKWVLEADWLKTHFFRERRPRGKEMTEEQKARRNAWAAYCRAGQLLGMDPVKLANMKTTRSDAIQDEGIMQLWTDQWHAENAGGDWGPTSEEGKEEI